MENIEKILDIMNFCNKTEEEVLRKISELNINTAENLYRMLIDGIKFDKIDVDTVRIYFNALKAGMDKEEIVRYINKK